jgi:hypothetical protein
MTHQDVKIRIGSSLSPEGQTWRVAQRLVVLYSGLQGIHPIEPRKLGPLLREEKRRSLPKIIKNFNFWL